MGEMNYESLKDWINRHSSIFLTEEERTGQAAEEDEEIESLIHIRELWRGCDRKQGWRGAKTEKGWAVIQLGVFFKCMNVMCVMYIFLYTDSIEDMYFFNVWIMNVFVHTLFNLLNVLTYFFKKEINFIDQIE